MIFKMHLSHRIVLWIFVAVPMPWAASEMYEGDSCTIKAHPGVCKLGSQCPELETAVRAGKFSSRDIVSCGFSTVEEIICCPTEDKVVTDNRSDDKFVFEQTTKPIAASTIATSTEPTGEDFWLHLLNSTPKVNSRGTEEETTTERPFWLDLLSTTSTTTTPKTLIVNGEKVDPNQRFLDLIQLMSDTDKHPGVRFKDEFEKEENSSISQQLPQLGRNDSPTYIDDSLFSWQTPSGVENSNVNDPRNIDRNHLWGIPNSNVNWNPPDSQQTVLIELSPFNNDPRSFEQSPHLSFQFPFKNPAQQSFRPVIEKPRMIRSMGDEGNSPQPQQNEAPFLPENEANATLDETIDAIWEDLFSSTTTTTTTPKTLVLNGEEVDTNQGFIDLTELMSGTGKQPDGSSVHLSDNVENTRQRPPQPINGQTHGSQNHNLGIQNPNSNWNGPQSQQMTSMGTFPVNNDPRYFERGPPMGMQNSNGNWNGPQSQQMTSMGTFPINNDPRNFERGPPMDMQNSNGNWNGPQFQQMDSIRTSHFNNDPRDFEHPRRFNPPNWEENRQSRFQHPAQQPFSGNLLKNQIPNIRGNIMIDPIRFPHRSVRERHRMIRSMSGDEWSFSQQQQRSLANNQFLNRQLETSSESDESSSDPIARINQNLINSGFEIIKANPADFTQRDSHRFSGDGRNRATTTPRSTTSERTSSFRFPTEEEEGSVSGNNGWRSGQSNTMEYIDPRRVWGRQSKKPQADDDDRPTRRPTTTTTKKTTIAPVPTRTTERPAVVACREIDAGLDNGLTPHILGGTPAELGEFPHMAVIGYASIGNEQGPYDYRCGGTLISNRYVLTAAHCVTRTDSQPAVVLLGTVNLTDAVERRGAQEIPVRQVHIHPDYSNSRTYHDVAVLQLEREVKYTEFIYPTCLYTDLNDPPSSLPLYVTGFGKISTTTKEKSNILLKAKLEAVSVSDCNVTYVANELNRRINEGVQTKQMCAHDPGFTRDACQGDSGGPLNVVLDESVKKYRVVGIISAGFSCGSSIPGLYARVAAYLDFIEGVVWPN